MKILILSLILIGLSFLFKKNENKEYDRMIQNFRIEKIENEKIKLVSGKYYFYISPRVKLMKYIVGQKLRVKATLEKKTNLFKTISIKENGRNLSFKLLSKRLSFSE